MKSETEIPRPTVLCAPILVFTQTDANTVAAKCPYTPKEGCENLLFVVGGATKEGIETGRGEMYVIHHAKDEKTGEVSIVSEWKVEVGMKQTPNKHVFEAHIQ